MTTENLFAATAGAPTRAWLDSIASRPKHLIIQFGR